MLDRRLVYAVSFVLLGCSSKPGRGPGTRRDAAMERDASSDRDGATGKDAAMDATVGDGSIDSGTDAGAVDGGPGGDAGMDASVGDGSLDAGTDAGTQMCPGVPHSEIRTGYLNWTSTASADISITLQPCEAVTFTVTSTGFGPGGTAISFNTFAEDGTQLIDQSFLSPQNAGSTHIFHDRGRLGVSSHPTRYQLVADAWSFDYRVVAEIVQRDGFNTAGTSTTTALALQLPTEIAGNLMFLPNADTPPHYFSFDLDAGDTLNVSGTHICYGVGCNLTLRILDGNGGTLAMSNSVGDTTGVAVSSSYTNTTGQAGTFFLCIENPTAGFLFDAGYDLTLSL